LIDLHCHILPGIDDGPPDTEASVALARALAADGVRTVAATPHLRSDHPSVVVGELAERCGDLNDTLVRLGVRLLVVPGGEVDLLWAQAASADDLRLASYGQRGTDLLVETPYGPLPSIFEDLLSRLQSAGFRILLGHPERNPTFQRDPQRLARLASNGVLVQVTASSLAKNPRRSTTARLAHALVEESAAHVIASDAHSLGAYGRVLLSGGVSAAARTAPDRSVWMATAAPEAILAGEPLPSPPLEKSEPKRGLWARLAGS